MPNIKWVRVSVMFLVLSWLPWAYLFSSGEFLRPQEGALIGFAAYVFYYAVSMIGVVWCFINRERQVRFSAVGAIVTAGALLLSALRLPEMSVELGPSKTMSLLMLAASGLGLASFFSFLGAYGFFDFLSGRCRPANQRKERLS